MVTRPWQRSGNNWWSWCLANGWTLNHRGYRMYSIKLLHSGWDAGLHTIYSYLQLLLLHWCLLMSSIWGKCGVALATAAESQSQRVCIICQWTLEKQLTQEDGTGCNEECSQFRKAHVKKASWKMKTGWLTKIYGWWKQSTGLRWSETGAIYRMESSLKTSNSQKDRKT